MTPLQEASLAYTKAIIHYWVCHKRWMSDPSTQNRATTTAAASAMYEVHDLLDELCEAETRAPSSLDPNAP